MKLTILSVFRSKQYQTALILFIISSIFSIKLNSNSNNENLKKNSFENFKEKEKFEASKKLGNSCTKSNQTEKGTNPFDSPKRVVFNSTKAENSFKSLKEDLMQKYLGFEEEKFGNIRFKQTGLKHSLEKTLEQESFDEFAKEILNVDGHLLKINLRYLTKDEIEVLKKLLKVFFYENSVIRDLQNQLKKESLITKVFEDNESSNNQNSNSSLTNIANEQAKKSIVESELMKKAEKVFDNKNTDKILKKITSKEKHALDNIINYPYKENKSINKTINASSVNIVNRNSHDPVIELSSSIKNVTEINKKINLKSIKNLNNKEIKYESKKEEVRNLTNNYNNNNNNYKNITHEINKLQVKRSGNDLRKASNHLLNTDLNVILQKNNSLDSSLKVWNNLNNTKSEKNKTKFSDINYFANNKDKFYPVVPKIILPVNLNERAENSLINSKQFSNRDSDQFDVLFKSDLHMRKTENGNETKKMLNLNLTKTNSILTKKAPLKISEHVSRENLEQTKFHKLSLSVMKKSENENFIEVTNTPVKDYFKSSDNYNNNNNNNKEDNGSLSFSSDYKYDLDSHNKGKFRSAVIKDQSYLNDNKNTKNLLSNSQIQNEYVSENALENLNLNEQLNSINNEFLSISDNYINQLNSENSKPNENFGFNRLKNKLFSDNLHIVGDGEIPVFNSFNKPSETIETDDTIFFLERGVKQNLITDPHKIVEEYHKPKKGGLFNYLDQEKAKNNEDKTLQNERLQIIKDLKEISLKCKTLKEKIKLISQKNNKALQGKKKKKLIFYSDKNYLENYIKTYKRNYS